MRSSTSFFNFLRLVCLAASLCLATGRLARAEDAGATASPSRARLIAVLPIINLSGAPVPLKEIRAALVAEAAKRGMTILGEKELEQFMARHRLRYSGGVDEATAQALHDETGVESVLVTALQQYDAIYPPKIAIDARLIACGAAPQILWADAVAMAGDDAPGLFGIGLIDTLPKLAGLALRRLTDSLASGVAGEGRPATLEKLAGRFRPGIAFRSAELMLEKKSRIAVVPFFNRSQRSYAGEILALHFVRELARQGNVTVIEPGLVRQKFLAFRLIMDEGLSLANAGVLFEVLDVDFILTGTVMDYDDYEGSAGTPQVAFSAWLLDRRNQRIVWTSDSHNSGADGIHPFELGKQHTAHLLGANMARGVTEQMTTRATTGASASTPDPPTGAQPGLSTTSTTKEGEQ